MIPYREVSLAADKYKPVIEDYEIKVWNKGLITRIENDEVLPKSAAEDVLNWFPLGDRIELRRGRQLMGAEVAGVGLVTGFGVARRYDESGTERLFSSRDRKIEYYDDATDAWIESGANVLPAGASGEDVAFSPYNSITGSFMFASSPNSSIYKIPAANPASVVDLLSTDFRGKIKIAQSRMKLWDRKDANGGRDKTGLYGSYIDKDELADFTEILAEAAATGDGATLTFSGTLAFKAGFPKRTCMYVRITDGVEILTDDRDGNLVGNLGGTGTINYATGAYSVTFHTAPLNLAPITASYYWEDTTANGIADFSKSATRTAGQGFRFAQDEGGALQNVGTISGDDYCLHTVRTYKLTLGTDDTTATNLIYRVRAGIPNWRAVEESEDGLYYIHALDVAEPAIRLLKPSVLNIDALPKSISDNLNLSPYRFEKGVLREWGQYILAAGRESSETINNRCFFFHKVWKTWTITDFRLSDAISYKGQLVGGDSGSANRFVLFSGLTDEEVEIQNFYTLGKMNLGNSGIKVTNLMVLGGMIGPEQAIKAEISLDNGPFVEVGGSDVTDGAGVTTHHYAIEGTGDYVDQSASHTIGATLAGDELIGSISGGTDIELSPYRREFRINTDRYKFIRVRFSAVKVGYASVSDLVLKDNRFKGRTEPAKYVVN